MSRRRGKAPWHRRNGGWIALAALVVAVGVFLFWPRTAAYARYVDGERPTVVFVWSDPTLHHPHG